MSVLKVYSIFDSAVNEFAPPFVFKNNGEAIRFFVDLADIKENPTSFIAKHKKDYTLFEIGTFEQSSAVITSLIAPVRLGSAQEFLPDEASAE